MFKKRPLIITVIIVFTLCIGFGFVKLSPMILKDQKMNHVKILTELPSEIERTNPVSEVRNWDSKNRTFYYFNWGFKPTSGYSLNLVEIKGHKLIIQAFSPDQSSINAQVLTYPYLLLSLPKGNYSYEVIDKHNQFLKDIFHPKNPPLKFTIFVPSETGDISERKILRDPYLNNEGKTTAQIALEALFAQDEMMEYLDHDVMVDGVSFSTSQKKWFVLLSRGYQTLTKPERELLNQLITKTVQSIETIDLENVEITTDPSNLPILEN